MRLIWPLPRSISPGRAFIEQLKEECKENYTTVTKSAFPRRVGEISRSSIRAARGYKFYYRRELLTDVESVFFRVAKEYGKDG